MPKVSVVIPAYNAEDYIEQSIGSLCYGSFRDFELLLIDDDSTDDTPEIVKELMDDDSRIRLIHQKHGGVSAARNLGIREAKGEYIAFVDADDYVEPEYLERLVAMAEESDLDWVCSAYNRMGERARSHAVFPENTVIDGEYMPDELIKKIFQGPDENILSSSCMGIYNLPAIRESRVTFNENLAYGEDLLFNYDLAHKIQGFGYIAEPLYNYMSYSEDETTNQDADSETDNEAAIEYNHSVSIEDNFKLFTALEEARRAFDEEYTVEYLSYIAIQIRKIFQFDILLRLTKEARQAGYEDIARRLREEPMASLWKEIGEKAEMPKISHEVFFNLLKKENFGAMEILRPVAKLFMAGSE